MSLKVKLGELVFAVVVSGSGELLESDVSRSEVKMVRDRKVVFGISYELSEEMFVCS